MSNAADEELLNLLHEKQTELLIAKVKEYLENPDDADPRVMQAVNAFLKQNNITARRSSDRMLKLLDEAKKLPDFDEDNNQIRFA